VDPKTRDIMAILVQLNIYREELAYVGPLIESPHRKSRRNVLFTSNLSPDTGRYIPNKLYVHYLLQSYSS